MFTDVAALFDLAGKKGPARKKTNAQKLTQEEEVVTTCGKDDRVGILRAVGRVLYPKCMCSSVDCAWGLQYMSSF